MKKNKVTLLLRRNIQRAMNGKLYIERFDGVEDEDLPKLHEIFPMLFSGISRNKGVYDITLTIKRIK